LYIRQQEDSDCTTVLLAKEFIYYVPRMTATNE